MTRFRRALAAALVVAALSVAPPLGGSAQADPQSGRQSSPDWEGMCNRLGTAVEKATGSLELGINTYVACMANMP